MIKRVQSLTAIFIAALFVTNSMPVFAEEAQSYEQLSPDGKYAFVMLTKGPAKAGKLDTLKSKYAYSGLYKINKPEKPLWRINWYASTVHISSDGVHLVRVGRPNVESMNGKPDMAQLALAFYKNGKLVKKYLVGQLISKPSKFVKAVTGFKWQERIAFDDEMGRLDVTLVTGQKKVFSIKTGKIISDKSEANKGR